MRRLVSALLISLSILAAYSPYASASTPKVLTFKAEIWADNWFALYINGKKVGEDSVSIRTERSFNSETLTFRVSYPFTIGVIAKDYTENASGLEYIGKPNQQIGDAGIAIQISEASSKKLVTYSDSTWRTLIINKAPLNEDCVTSKNPITDCKSMSASQPRGWSSTTFNDAKWSRATQFTREEVGVKEGFFDINWSPKVQLIWSGDLRLDNTILLRKKISAISTTSSQGVLSGDKSKTESLTLTGEGLVNGGDLPAQYTCDGLGISPALRWIGVPKGAKSLAIVMDSIPGPPRPGEVDAGKHFYFILYNISPGVGGIAEGQSDVGTLGQNFIGKTRGYTPPCSQGPGAKKYTITLFALSSVLELASEEANLTNLENAMSGKILESTSLSLIYSRK